MKLQILELFPALSLVFPKSFPKKYKQKKKSEIIGNKGDDKMKRLVKIANQNLEFLAKELNSTGATKYSGKWVAVAKKKICYSARHDEALKKISKFEPKREKVLLMHIPKSWPFS